MAETRICHHCGATVPAKASCAACAERIPALPDPATMTLDARLAEFDGYDGPLEVPFPVLHARVEKLLGRPVWTHEFASSVWPRLRVELESGEAPSMAQVIGKVHEINPDLKIVMVQP